MSGIYTNDPEEVFLSVRIVQDIMGDDNTPQKYTQTLLKIKELEISNIDVKVIHANGDTNIAKFSSPASIFIMEKNNTIDHLKF